MIIGEIRHLRGVNAWSEVAALHAVLRDLPEGPFSRENELWLEDQFRQLCVPPQIAHAAARRRQRSPAVREAAEVVLELAGEMQFLCGEFHGLGEVSRNGARGVCHVALECRVFELAEACLRRSVEYLRQLLAGRASSLSDMYAALLAMAANVCPVSSPGLVISAANDRGIPVFRLGPDQVFGLAPDEVLQLGEGVHQRRLHPWGTMTDRTGFLAGHLANDKAFVKTLWSRYGIPVPAGHVVTDEIQAQQAALALGGPVVVKPIDAECSRGLTLRSTTPEEVSAAFQRAKGVSASGHILVERHHPGTWHRLLVVDQRLVAALRRETASVVGDGCHTIRELVEAANCDRRRGPDDRWPLRFLELDETEIEVLFLAGLTPDSIVAIGRRVALRITASAASGAESFDVTERVHPETVELALEAVRLIGLDVAGLDLVATDISRPLADQQGAFLEINEQPAIFLHAAPLCSPPRPVGEAIVESLFPEGQNGRIPLVVVIGNSIADQTVDLLAERLATAGRVIGLSTPARTSLGGRTVTAAGLSLPDRLQVLLRHPRTEMVVVSAPLEEVLHSGLGTDRCTILVAAEGAQTSATESDLTRKVRGQLMNRLSMSAQRLVINTDDSDWQKWGRITSPDVCLVTSEIDNPQIGEHLTAGGIAAIAESSGVIIQAGGTQTRHYPCFEGLDGKDDDKARIAHALAHASSFLLTRTSGTTGRVGHGRRNGPFELARQLTSAGP